MVEPDIEQILAQRLQLAQKAFERARDTFKETTSDIPSPLPHPDGTQEIRNAGNSYREAMNSYALALRDFNEFLLSRTIPAQLKEELASTHRLTRIE